MKTIRQLIDKCWDLAESGEIDGSILPNLDDCEEEFRLAKIKLKKLLISDVVKSFYCYGQDTASEQLDFNFKKCNKQCKECKQ